MNFKSAAAAPSPPSPRLSGKMRRKALLSDTLSELSAVQRLVEYFVVVSSQPRWLEPPPLVDDTSQDSGGTGNSSNNNNNNNNTGGGKLPPRKRGRRLLSRGAHRRKPVPLESRQGTPPSAREAGPSCTGGGNIHLPQHVGVDHTFQPKITARYPLEDHEDNPLNPMILQFCYPSDDVIVPSRYYDLPRVHHFVLTNEKGRKVYGTCLTIFEEYHADNDGPWRSHASEEFEVEGDGVEVSVLDKSKTLYIPKVLCLLSTWPYLTAFKEYLAQLYRLASATNVMNAPIERYIVNLCCEIPAPPPGAYEIQVKILNSTIRFWAPPAKLPIAFVGLPFQILFECLDVDNIMKVWSALIMERKVLLLSSQHSILTVCAEIFCSLLFPLRWSHLYVPLLPKMLSPMLDAPVPYLCGVVRESWLYAKEYLSSETIVVDLDRNSVQLGDDLPPIPPAPPRKWNKLKTTLTETVGHVFWRAHGLENEYLAMMSRKPHKRSLEKLRQSQGNSTQWRERLAGLDHAFSLAFTPDSPNLLNDTLPESEQNQWNTVQEGFLRFFVAVLKCYRRHLRLPSQNAPGTKPSFDRLSFIAREKAENVAFLNELCATQQFDDFLTRRMYSPGEPDLVFFDQSIDAKLNRSRLKLKKVDTPFLNSAKVHKELKKLKAVLPNEDGLVGCNKPFIYKTWPSEFNTEYLCRPRPIPKMISAEFDRQAYLVSKLRANILDMADEDLEIDSILDFYGGDYYPSPHVAAFTTFFFAYSALVGRDWQQYSQRRREAEAKRAADDAERDRTIEEDYTPVVVITPDDQRAADGCLADLSMGTLNSCPKAGVVAFKSSIDYLDDTDVCETFCQRRSRDLADIQQQLSSREDKMVSAPSNDDAYAEYEEAREVASAQLGLAFETLSTLALRGYSADSDAYVSIMEACGRCGDTQRAIKLIELMKADGFVADSEVLSCFVSAFAVQGTDGVDIGSPAALVATGKQDPKVNDAYSQMLKRRLDMARGKQEDHVMDVYGSQCLPPTLGLVESSGTDTQFEELSQTSIMSSESSRAGPSPFFDWTWLAFHHHHTPSDKKRTRRRRRKQRTANTAFMPVTDMLARQLELGENLLEFLYPGLVIDTNCDSCPHCSHRLCEDDVVDGWSPCAFQDYTTRCSRCQHRFVPNFTVSCKAEDFEGSQGPQTPLYCEFLSPWVIRKELQSVVKGPGGIEAMLQPNWRRGNDIRATIFWNMIVHCRRYRLPFSFLLQGSFRNRLVLPRMPNEM